MSNRAFLLVTVLVTRDGERGHPMDTITTRVDLDDTGAGNTESIERFVERVQRQIRDKARRGVHADDEERVTLVDRAVRLAKHPDVDLVVLSEEAYVSRPEPWQTDPCAMYELQWPNGGTTWHHRHEFEPITPIDAA